MRVLIIGPGYVGLPLAAELVRQGHQVFGLRRGGDSDGTLRAHGVQGLAGDISRIQSLKSLPERSFDWVVNCVSSSHGGVADYRQVYLQGAQNVVEWLRESPPTKLVYTSSTGVYGQNDGSRVDETSPTEPAAETSRVLVETEQEWIKAAHENRLPAVVLRVAGIYGPGRSWYLQQLLAGEARIEGEGKRHLNMIHREDVGGCIIAALERGVPGEIYNAVDDEPVMQREFLGWLAKRLGRPVPPNVAASVEVNRKRGISDKRINNRKLKTALGYQFLFPTFREGYGDVLAGRG